MFAPGFNVRVRSVRVHVEAASAQVLSARLDVVRLLPASTANVNATALIDGTPVRSSSSGPLLANRRDEAAIARDFDVPAQLPLYALLGTAFFQRGFAVELGFSADSGAGDGAVSVAVYSVRVELFLDVALEISSIAPLSLPTRLGGDTLTVAGAGFPFLGGVVCRVGDKLALGRLVANGTAAPTPAPTPDYGDERAPPPAPTPRPTSVAGAARVECLAPRQRSSGAYLFQLSIDGGSSFSDSVNAQAQIVIGKAEPLPSPLPRNHIIVRAKRNDTQFQFQSADVTIDAAAAADAPIMELALGEVYTFIGDTHCDHPIYLSTGRGGSQAFRPDDAPLPDRLDNGVHRETCENRTFEFRPTISYPETLFIASTRNSTFGRKIKIKK